MTPNVSANNAVVARAKKCFIYQNAERHNGATTIINFQKNGAPLFAVLVAVASTDVFSLQWTPPDAAISPGKEIRAGDGKSKDMRVRQADGTHRCPACAVVGR